MADQYMQYASMYSSTRNFLEVRIARLVSIVIFLLHKTINFINQLLNENSMS